MRLELQKLKQEEGSSTLIDGDSISNLGSVSQMNKSGSRSEIEKMGNEYSGLKCRICNQLPPCPHSEDRFKLKHTKSTDDETIASRLESMHTERKVFIPETPKSREIYLQEEDLNQNQIKLSSNIFKTADETMKISDKYIYQKGSRREERKQKFSILKDDKFLPDISVTNIPQADPKFKSEYKFPKDEDLGKLNSSTVDRAKSEPFETEFK